MINNIISRYGFGILLMILIAVIYTIIAIITFKKRNGILIISTILFIIGETILIYMYTAHQ